MGNKTARQVYRMLMNPDRPERDDGQPASHTFSVEPSAAPNGASLTCPNIALPTGWNDVDLRKGFGPLKVVMSARYNQPSLPV